MTSYIRPGILLTHVANPILSRLGSFPALIVRGRRSGEMLTVPMDEPLHLNGRAYLVSGRGETHWVRNLRAAGSGVLRLHGTRSAFRAVEVTGAEHDAVVDAYRRKLGHRVDAYFEAMPETGRTQCSAWNHAWRVPPEVRGRARQPITSALAPPPPATPPPAPCTSAAQL